VRNAFPATIARPLRPDAWNAATVQPDYPPTYAALCAALADANAGSVRREITTTALHCPSGVRAASGVVVPASLAGPERPGEAG